MTKKILVLNGRSYAAAVEGLGEIECDHEEFFKKPSDFGLILFTGGEDITPEWYGDKSPLRMCYNNIQRDKMELYVLSLARKHNVRCIGICRGVQFLNVLSDGKMYHDVNNHAGKHHNVITSSGEVIRVNSLHHQMIIPAKDSYVIAWADERMSTRYYGEDDRLVDGPGKEPEAALFPEMESAGVQWHPELLPVLSRGRGWFYGLAEDLLNIRKFSDIIEKYTEAKCKLNTEYTTQ